MSADLMQPADADLEPFAKVRLLAVLGEQSDVDLAGFVPLAGLLEFLSFLPAGFDKCEPFCLSARSLAAGDYGCKK
jgi:hypothetical protein